MLAKAGQTENDRGQKLVDIPFEASTKAMAHSSAGLKSFLFGQLLKLIQRKPRE
jgi:hypothetical protein